MQIREAKFCFIGTQLIGFSFPAHACQSFRIAKFSSISQFGMIKIETWQLKCCKKHWFLLEKKMLHSHYFPNAKCFPCNTNENSPYQFAFLFLHIESIVIERSFLKMFVVQMSIQCSVPFFKNCAWQQMTCMDLWHSSKIWYSLLTLRAGTIHSCRTTRQFYYMIWCTRTIDSRCTVRESLVTVMPWWRWGKWKWRILATKTRFCLPFVDYSSSFCTSAWLKIKKNREKNVSLGWMYAW